MPRPEPRGVPRWIIVSLIVAVTLALVSMAFAGVTIAHNLTRATSASGTGGTGGSGNGSGLGSGNGDGQAPSVGNAGAATNVLPAIVNITTTLGLQQASAAGTGIVLTSNGEVLTNNHVIDGSTSISVTDVGNGQTYQATVVGYDRTDDLAVIKLQGASGLKTAPLGDSSKVTTGDGIVAAGNAGGRGGTPTVVTGTVTATDQTITASDQGGGNAETLNGLIQIAADIQPGDSGGPLINSAGKVIGIDTAATAGFRFQASGGQGYAIPINQALTVAKQIESGRASSTVHIGATAFLGVEVSAGDSGTGGNFGSGQGTGQTSGATISGVVSGSPAEQAGLTAGDVITSVDGTAVDSPTALTNLLSGKHPGDRVTVGYTDQSGQSHSATVALATGPAA